MQWSEVHHSPPRRWQPWHEQQPFSPLFQSSAFVNHTPREFELSRLFHSASPSSEMLYEPPSSVPAAGSALGNSDDRVVGRQRLFRRQLGPTRPGEDEVPDFERQEAAGHFYHLDPGSCDQACTNQAPYCSSSESRLRDCCTGAANMSNTSTSLPRVPRRNDSADLIWFLKNTGPSTPNRERSSDKGSKRTGMAASSQRALKLIRGGPKRQVGRKRNMSNIHLADVGGLLSPAFPPGLANTVEQRQTSSGSRYLAMRVPENARMIEAEIVESRVSISFQDVMPSEVVNEYFPYRGRPVTPRTTFSSPPGPPGKDVVKETTVRVIDYSSSPVRPAASSPPTPQPDSAVSTEGSYGLADQPALRSLSPCRALTSHPVRQQESLTALPKISLPKEEFPVKHPSAEKDIKIWEPAPRRLASHPVLLQRAPSIASSLYPRSTSESPGPPPPRSPLRLRRDARTIENIIASHNRTHPRTITPKLTLTPKLTPTIEVSAGYNEALAAMRPTVITQCTGPITRPRSRGDGHLQAFAVSRRESEDRAVARRLRDRSQSQTLGALLSAAPSGPLRRLRKARPPIQTSELQPMPLNMRGLSSASSDMSWKKAGESTRIPVSPVPLQEESVASGGEKTGYTPISATSPNDSAAIKTRMAFSPVMLVAEEIPVPKVKPPLKPAKLIIKDGRNYAPRPRSASIPRNMCKRQSRPATSGVGARTSSRRGSPAPETVDSDTPPLPSPPPNRALPPTPPASGSEEPAKTASVESKKELPTPPAYEILPQDTRQTGRVNNLPHVVTQTQRKGLSSKEARIEARLKQLEKHNAMLEAALMAVLRTNGSLNSPLSALMETKPDSPKAMVWESRIARRSAASHTASSSNGSALDMYMSTRRGSKVGYGGV